MTRRAVMQREAIAPAAASPHGGLEQERKGACLEPEREGAPALPTIALLLLVKFPARAVPWGLSRLVLGVRGLGSAPGLRFARVLGSGRDGGFGLAPGFDHQGFIAFFDDAAQAQAFADHSKLVRGYRDHAVESLTVLMRATSARGSWGGVGFAVTARQAADAPVRCWAVPEAGQPPWGAASEASVGAPARRRAVPEAGQPPWGAASEASVGAPVAAITRASIRLRHAARFWRHAPATHEGIARAPGCRLAIGLGEAPLLRQATFSLWDHSDALEAYARGGAHLAASRDALQQGWFSESMFLRLAPLSITGQWRGRTYG